MVRCWISGRGHVPFIPVWSGRFEIDVVVVVLVVLLLLLGLLTEAHSIEPVQSWPTLSSVPRAPYSYFHEIYGKVRHGDF